MDLIVSKEKATEIGADVKRKLSDFQLKLSDKRHELTTQSLRSNLMSIWIHYLNDWLEAVSDNSSQRIGAFSPETWEKKLKAQCDAAEQERAELQKSTDELISEKATVIKTKKGGKEIVPAAISVAGMVVGAVTPVGWVLGGAGLVWAVKSGVSYKEATAHDQKVDSVSKSLQCEAEALNEVAAKCSEFFNSLTNASFDLQAVQLCGAESVSRVKHHLQGLLSCVKETLKCQLSIVNALVANNVLQSTALLQSLNKAFP